MNKVPRTGLVVLALGWFGGVTAACDKDSAPSRPAEEAPAPAAEEPRSPTGEAEERPQEKRVRGEEVSYRARDVALKGYLAWDEQQSGERPGILVVHEWWGHNDYVRSRARALAEMGYTAFAVDMYGDGKQADHPEDAKKFMMEVFNDMESGTARFQAAYALLQQHRTTRAGDIAAIGYCFGGAIVLHMARAGMDLDLVASFHPGSLATEAPAAPGSIKGKVYVALGDDDPFVPPEQRTAFREEMKKAKVDYEFVGFPGVKHGFTVPEATERGKKMNLPLAYDQKADRESWSHLERLLTSIF